MSIIAVIPAAGIGQRMNQEVPKQYLTLLGKSILEHSIS
ncbi:MAG TPA: 2-C-methyl-D-erythritol 4-phosphate cytidylyltransferase, partial [Aliidiomarina sp.]|nr:2-C-methyl-D-erythritol 4-phosphate cytidylyltransferase [Aliidiomarina sp.]